jgi:hypothetical protein
MNEEELSVRSITYAIRKSFEKDPSLQGSKVICDETNNSLESINNGVIHVTIVPPVSLDRITVNIVSPSDFND